MPLAYPDDLDVSPILELECRCNRFKNLDLIDRDADHVLSYLKNIGVTSSIPKDPF